MNRIASELLLIARELLGMNFPTKEALDDYMKSHPKGDRHNHFVVPRDKDKHPNWMKEHNKKLEHDNKERRQTALSGLTKSGFEEKESSACLKDLWWGPLNTINRLCRNGSVARIVKKKKVELPKLIQAISGITAYVGSAHSFDINADLRAGKKNEHADGIRTMIEIGPKNKSDKVFRGMAVSKDEIDKLGIKEGSVFTDDGFISVSTDNGVSAGFAMNSLDSKDKTAVLFDICGASRRGLSISALGGVKQVSANHEVLLPPKTRFRITGVSEEDFGELKKMHKNRRFKPEHYVEGRTYLHVKAEITPQQKVASEEDASVLFDDLNDEETGHQDKRLSAPLSLKRVDVKKSMTAELLRIAAEVNPQITVVFDRKGTDERSLMAIQMEMQRFVSSIRNNEGLESIMSREDDSKTMKLSIGFTEHEAKDAIMREVKKLADRLASKSGIKARVE